MSRILWIDASAGAAGDMLCGALLDAGASLETLQAGLAGLALPGFAIHAQNTQRASLAATWFQVVLDSPESHPHRHHSDIQRLLEEASLPERVRRRSADVFARLAAAEGRVHGVPPEEVTFHEVGAVDSIVDIVAFCLLLEEWDIDQVIASPLPLGSGSIEGAHGVLPLPAPATVEVLKGWPCVQDGREGEWVTPTGAALIATLATPGAMPSMRPLQTGMGAGTRDPAGRANVVRVVLGEAESTTSTELVEVLETQVDDMTGEQVPPLLEALFEAGAIDATATPLLMKKGRPGLLITALATPDGASHVAHAMLEYSSSLGLRRHTASRQNLDRKIVEVATHFGPVRVKVGLRENVALHAAPEFEDCLARARENSVPLARVQAAAMAAYEAQR